MGKNKNYLSDQDNEKKICNSCREKKSLTEFYQHSGCKDGRISECKQCRIEKNKKYHQPFLEKNPGYNKLMNIKHRKRKTELQKIYNQKKQQERINV